MTFSLNFRVPLYPQSYSPNDLFLSIQTQSANVERNTHTHAHTFIFPFFFSNSTFRSSPSSISFFFFQNAELCQILNDSIESFNALKQQTVTRFFEFVFSLSSLSGGFELVQFIHATLDPKGNPLLLSQLFCIGISYKS